MTRANKPPIALYSALADVTRCQILEILKAGPVPVHRLSDNFSVSRPAISRHLRVLKQAGLVTEVKKGRENLYAFKPRRLDLAQAWLDQLAGTAAAAEKAVPPPVEAVAALPVMPPAEPAIVPVAAAVDTPPPTAEPRQQRSRPVAPAKPPESALSQMGFDF